MQSAIEGILFDKDGTLLDYHLSWMPINRRVALLAAHDDAALAARILAINGYDAAADRIVSGSLLAAGTTRDIAAGFIAAGSPWTLDELIPAIDAVFQSGVATVVPVIDLAAFFARLKARGLALGIASSDSAVAIERTCARFGFAGQVDFIAGWDSGFGNKPQAGMLDAFAARCGVAASRIAVVGDNLHDMEMARNGGAGLRIGVLTGTSARAELEGHCDFCLDSIRDLEAALFAV